MGTRPRRVVVLAAAFLLAACTAQVAAPRPSETPAPTTTPTATPRPSNASNDLLYVRTIGGGGQGSILLIDARTGATVRTMADGAISADRSTFFWPESIDGGTRTVMHVADLATGGELRIFTVEGDLRPFTFTGSTYEALGNRLTRDTRHLVLINTPYKTPDGWVTRLAVVDTSSGAIAGSIQIVSPSTYGVLGLSLDGRSVFIDQFGEGGTRTRIFDVASRTLVDLAGPGLSQYGFRTPAVFSPDGRWLYRLDSGSDAEAPYVLALDVSGRRAQKIELPLQQKSSDFEKYLIWSIALTPDGSTLYAANPALGVVDEIDALKLTLHRTHAITVSRTDGGALGLIGQHFFGAAEAKRYVIGGAVLSPDGRTLYAVAHDGILVIDTSALESRQVWFTKSQFDLLTLSPDGLRLYAVDNSSGNMLIVDVRDGARLGEVKLAGYTPAIVRIDSPR